MPDGVFGYWYSRFVFERGLALIYLVAFLCAANQFVPLVGEHGLMPASRFIRRTRSTKPLRVSSRKSPFNSSPM